MEKLADQMSAFRFEQPWRMWPIISLCMVPCVIFYLYKYLVKRKQGEPILTIHEIYIYPIKSFRAVKLQQALATKHGFQYDRRFALLKKEGTEYPHMDVSKFAEMTQFLQDIKQDEKNGTQTLTITFRAYGEVDKEKQITMPLVPDTEKLEPFEVNMHGSPTSTFKMPDKYSTWFSECFGFDVVLVYLGNNRRGVRFEDMRYIEPSRMAGFLKKNIPFVNRFLEQSEQWELTFADCAPYLVTSQTSFENVSSRFPEGVDLDMAKFRPNIVVRGAPEAWQEDYWGKIRINKHADVILPHNCVRCQSLNVDYATGKPGKGTTGEVLKRLQKDRRVDTGAKWSPVFGRYGFWDPRCESQVLKVGDRVDVLKVNERRTVWNWPSIS